jgi:hypothetical protein
MPSKGLSTGLSMQEVDRYDKFNAGSQSHTKLYPSGRQSHANCTCVAATRMQHESKLTEICMRLVIMWVQFARDWRPLGYHFQAIGGHSVTRQETSRQEGCKRPFLHQNYIFLALASPHPRHILSTIQLTALGYLVWKMHWYIWMK